MRSLLRHGSVRRAQPDPATTESSTGRTTRGQLRTMAAVAILGAAGTLAVAGPTSPAGQSDPAVAAADAPTIERHLPPAAASRSTERAQLPGVVSVGVDGATRTLVTTADTLGAALAEAGVTLGAEDEVSHPLGAAVPDGEVVSIARVTHADGVDRTPVAFATTERRDADLEIGRRIVATVGVPGTQTVTFRARLVDGQEVSREELLRTVIAPIDEVVRVGTKPPPPPPPAPAPTARATAPQSSSAAAAPRATTSAAPATGPAATGDPRSIARSMVAARGWGADQFTCLDRLWTKESNWNPRAQNRSSGAYGIPQSLPGSKMATVAADWRTNPATQITWGLNYISGRYGTPCAAWAHSQARNWY